MTETDLLPQGRNSPPLWWAVSACAVVVTLASIVQAFSFDLKHLLTLAAAAAVALLVARFTLSIPRTDAVVDVKTVILFWGISWLGLYSGVLLAIAASFSDHEVLRRDRSSWLRQAARDVFCAALAGVVYELTIRAFVDSANTAIAGAFLVPNRVIIASILMAATHLAARVATSLLAEQRTPAAGEAPVTGEALTLGHAAAFALSITLVLLFNHFGAELGLVILPMAVGANAAFRIHMRTLEQKTREISEASRVHLATVEALATAIDARDQVGLGHVRRTQVYATGLGRMLNLSSGELDALQTGALLHDIGKLAVPDHILNKPGRLTQAETEKTKIHSSVGASILEKVGFHTPVVPTVKYHHEFWDGSGYPEGLRGTQIPLTARILSVADAFDTLRSARPYRPAISRDDACNFMRAGAGTQFDPKIVDLLIRNLRAFEAEIVAEGFGYDSEMEPLKFDAVSSNFVEQIQRANHEVFTLYSIAKEFSSSLSLSDTLSLFTEKVAEFVPYDACAVFILDDSGEFASAVHVAGPKSSFLRGRRVKVGEGATGYALKRKKPVENVDPTLDFAFTSGSEDFCSMMCRPLIADDEIIGALSLYSSDLPYFQDEHIRLLDTVTRIAADAVARSLRHAEAETHAITDPITSLPNARSLHAEFDKEVKRAIRNDSTFQILMLDLDGFKAVNDNFGHKTGDRVLTAIGGVIRSQLRDYDFLARYAGDEFVALLPETDADSVAELCRRIKTAVDEYRYEVSAEESARVGVSIGSAAYPAQGELFDQLIISADKAMYEDKAARKSARRAAKAKKLAEREVISEPATSAEEFVPLKSKAAGQASGEFFVVELDETHVLISDDKVN